VEDVPAVMQATLLAPSLSLALSLPLAPVQRTLRDVCRFQFTGA
jgi:hypothetical protein